MIYLDDFNVALDSKECDNKINYVDFNMKTKYNKNNYALRINFMNDFKYSIKCIKKLIYFRKNKIDFLTHYKNYKLKYIILNYNEDILIALKALYISDIKERYIFLYDAIFHSLDVLWKKNNPCHFCNNICIASKNHKTSHLQNGCCYSFEYSKSPFKFIENVSICKYLSPDKQCTTQNLSCKFFVCKYLRKSHIFNINPNSFLLFNCFFDNKQKLILKYNFFKSKEEIIEKLLIKDTTPFIFYYLNNNYHI